MAYKIDIPDVSSAFVGAIMRESLNSGLEDILRAAGVVTSAIACGSTVSRDKLVDDDAFKAAVFDQYLVLHSEGYTPGDFQHVLLDYYSRANVELALYEHSHEACED